MKKILLSILAIICVSFGQTQAADVNTIKATIVKHSIEMGVDPAIALSIAKAESGFRHEARSSHGAVGVFQLLPSTASRMGLNAYSLNDNIRGGIMYYKNMYKMFGSMELALAAYNAGPGNVKRHNNTVPPYAETKRFIAKIMTDYNRLKANPDPVMLNATSGFSGAPKAAPVPVVVSPEDQLQVEIIDEKPIETDLKPETFSI